MVLTVPDEGVNDVTVGLPFPVSTVKALPLMAVPPGVVTLMRPVVAAAGTVAVIADADTTLNVVAMTPLNRTAVAPVKLAPMMFTPVHPEPDHKARARIP